MLSWAAFLATVMVRLVLIMLYNDHTDIFCLDERASLQDEFDSLVLILESQVFAESINHIPPEQSAQFYDYYLNDYLQSLHLPFENIGLAHEVIKSIFKHNSSCIILFALLLCAAF